MSDISYYTADGLKKLQDELAHLKMHERPSISRQIAEAREKGDLSENAEYDAAKDAQGMLEMKIVRLEDVIRNARLVDESKLDAGKILILSTAKLRNKTTGAEMSYTLVSEKEADLKAGKISISSPIGKGLLGKTIGEVAEISIPSGKIQLEVLDITR